MKQQMRDQNFPFVNVAQYIQENTIMREDHKVRLLAILKSSHATEVKPA